MSETFASLLPLLVFLGVLFAGTTFFSKRYYRKYEGHIDRVSDINEEILKSNRELVSAIERNTEMQEQMLKALSARQ